jgi:charged multivesicular body protein 2A
MALMGRQMNLPQIQKIMMEFEKESAMMDMKEEIMSEAVDGVMVCLPFQADNHHIHALNR